jgi:hypothetical protein
MEPVFLLIEGDGSSLFRMQFESEEEIQVLMHDSDSEESDSIDYGSDSEEDTAEFESESEDSEEAPPLLNIIDLIEEEPFPELQHALTLTRLEKLLLDCIHGPPSKVIESQEDYITALPFKPKQLAILISSAKIQYQQPLHIATVRKLLESGNVRNPCDNNTIEDFTLVQIQ